MSTRREEILREMGLEPIWRLRKDEDGRRKDEGGRTKAEQKAGEVTYPSSLIPHPSKVPTPQSSILKLSWAELKASVSTCKACRLHSARTQTVFGVGDEQADWLFIGEGPGAEEDKRGEPFVGQAGKLLDNMLAAIGLKRGENVYIANAVKCRPPGNRNPERDEIATCHPYLARQIELISPKLIVLLGRIAVQALLETEAALARLRGRLHDFRGIPVIVTYHPAYLLRNLPDKAKAWEDLCLAHRTMQRLLEGVNE
jgi:uracil-DNA glycosylase family 4